MNKKDFIRQFNNEGFAIIKNVISKSKIKKIEQELKNAIDQEVKYQGTKNYSYYGYVLSNAYYGGEFIKIFSNKKIIRYFDYILGKSSMVYSYTSSSMPPMSVNNSSKIHVDQNIFLKDFILRMGLIIPVTDFTINNGCTTYLPKSHKIKNKPSKFDYNKKKKNLIIKAGDAFYFNCRLWHSGGQNKTNNWRHAITINMCRPWMKQRIDIPELIKNKVDTNKMSFSEKQKLGFFSIPPKSYDDYFKSKTNRIF
jgi:ectoine hydroxylase-related dioxygenase (phytanoyl-CoA dioxygenase family)